MYHITSCMSSITSRDARCVGRACDGVGWGLGSRGAWYTYGWRLQFKHLLGVPRIVYRMTVAAPARGASCVPHPARCQAALRERPSGYWSCRGVLVYHGPMGLQRFPLGGFLGGMNLIDNPYSLKSGEAQLALNVDIGLRDVLGSRKGFTSAGLGGVVGSQTKSPTVVSTKAPGTTAWTNPENAKASDNAYATAALGAAQPETFSQQLFARGYGFVLPAGAIPLGVELNPEKKCASFSAIDQTVSLVKAGVVVGENLAKPGEWPVVDTVFNYGGSTSLWGTTISKADVENANFGAVLSAVLFALETASVDHIPITVYYIVEGITTSTEHARPWYSGAKRRLIMSQNGIIRSLDTSVITELFAGTAATVWSFEQMEYNPGAGYKDSLWAMNGTDAAKKWDGTTFANWGGKPPKGTMLRVWKNRMIVSGVAAFPQRVFFSDVANPELPEDETNGGYGNNWIDIRTSEDDLDPVIWLEVIDDVLIVFKKKSVNAIYDPTSFSFQRIANVGCEGRFQSCVIDSRCYFLNRAGIYSVTAQGESRYESINLEPLFKGTGPPALEAIDLNLLATSGRMCSLPNGRIYAAVTPKGSLANRWLLEGYPRLRVVSSENRYDPRTPWVHHSFSKRCIKCLCAYRTKDEEVDKVIAGLTNEAGAVPELAYLFEGVRDGLESIAWQWQSGFKSLISEEPKERIRRLNLLMKGRVLAAVIADGVTANSATLETAEVGTKQELKFFRPETRGRYHSVVLSGSSQIATQIFKGELVLRGGKEER